MKRGRAALRTHTTIPPTSTLVETRARASEPVEYLRGLPKGPLHRLADFTDPRDRLQWIGIGRGPGCHIQLTDEYVSEAHCLLQCSDLGVVVQDNGSKNLTLLNGVPVLGSARLLPGMLLTLGTTTMLACGPAAEAQEPLLVAIDIDEFLRSAAALYGSTSKAARALEIATTTLAEWLRKGRFKRKMAR